MEDILKGLDIEHKNQLTKRRIALVKLWGTTIIFSVREAWMFISPD